mmetsp:Transcript_22445/g.31602  ORF Transcript_22445/g.31602 Transcript_22445/m.31602 type:complete len:160 (-) Transcript_22445:292-771(-)
MLGSRRGDLAMARARIRSKYEPLRTACTAPPVEFLGVATRKPSDFRPGGSLPRRLKLARLPGLVLQLLAPFDHLDALPDKMLCQELGGCSLLCGSSGTGFRELVISAISSSSAGTLSDRTGIGSLPFDADIRSKSLCALEAAWFTLGSWKRLVARAPCR